jgi:hypothetical protein
VGSVPGELNPLELLTETYCIWEKLHMTKLNKIFGNAVPNKAITYKPPKQLK